MKKVKMTNVEKWKEKQRLADEKVLELLVENQVNAAQKIIDTVNAPIIPKKLVAGIRLQTDLAKHLLEIRGHTANKGPQTVKNTQINYNLSADFTDEERIKFLEEVKVIADR